MPVMGAWLLRQCPLCRHSLKASEPGLCAPCLARQQVFHSECWICGVPVPDLNPWLCGPCALLPDPVAVIYGCRHHELIARGVLKLKNQQQMMWLPILGDLLIWKLRCLSAQGLAPVEGLVPVPCHPSTLRRRGFNQASLIAHYVGKALGLPVFDGLVVTLGQAAEQKKLSKKARLQNAEHRFLCQGALAVNAVAVVDDVYTTGATAMAMQAALSEKIQQVWTLTRA